MRQLERQRPIRRDEYEKMVSAGLFQNERIELIRGVIIEMSPQNIPHASAIEVLNELLVLALVGRAAVRVQLPFNVGDDSVPEPDFAIVAPVRPRDAHPDRAFLLIEVANTSLSFDRHEKAELYAGAGVPEYWIVNVVDQTIERHTEPAGERYARITTHHLGEDVPLQAFPDVSVSVARIFAD